MRDEWKSVVPASPATRSRRLTPQQHQSPRPSDSSSATAARSVQPSPRVKAHPVAEPTRADVADASSTFITALAATKQRSQRLSTVQPRLALDNKKCDLELRPPSPLEAADADQPRGTVSGEPQVANYVGMEALQSFWRMFHREEEVHNHTQTGSAQRQPTGGSQRAQKKKLTMLPALVLPPSDRPRSARSTYLAAVRKLQLSPEPMGIVRRRAPDKGVSSSVANTTSSSLACVGGSSTQEINLSSYRMGDVYATAFSESFALVPGVESVNLASNRISDAVAARLVRNAFQAPVAASLQSLNLSHNALGSTAARAIADLLKASKSLTSLNLSHNRLKDRDIAVLCDALQNNQTMARVHLSENRFGIAGMVAIAKFLEENAKIEEVYLAWNNLRGLGAFKIVEALKFHASIRVLDLSWNALDSNDLLKPRAIVSALADAIANNKVLAHLDLSNNHLDMEDCGILARHLEVNHTLVGLHMSGNCGVMSTRGFLIPKQTQCKLLDQHKMYSIAVFEEAMSDSGSGSVPPHVAQLVDKFCWYCGQWSEHRFAWTPPADALVGVRVKLHLSHDDWQGTEMEKREDGSYSAYSILPPGKTEYFYSVSDKAASSNTVSYHYVKEKRHVRAMHLSNKPDVSNELHFVNVLRNARREGRDPCNMVQPRTTSKGNDRPLRWDINRSVFARRRRETVQRSFVDTDAFVQKACTADWRQCKVDRFVKDPTRRKEVEACVTRHFRTISNVYRRYCGNNILTSVAVVAAVTPAVAIQIQNDVMSVPWSGYVEFISEAKILDENSEFCRYADLENVFVAANLELTQEAKEKDNPDRSLTRFEFMEAVMRIAINKFLRTNVCDSPAKAVEKLVVDHLVPICPEDPNDFRSKFLYTEEVSDIFSEHIVLLQDVYNSNMGRFCKPGEKKGMQLVEFLNVMELYQVYSDFFKIRDVKDPFLACKLVVLDEMATAGHKKLMMTDFMELLLRVAVLRYPPRPVTLQEMAKSLQKLFINHFLKHEALLEQLQETVDQVVVQQRIEAFADAISTQNKGKKGRRRLGPADIEEEDQEDEENDDVDDDEVPTITNTATAVVAVPSLPVDGDADAPSMAASIVDSGFAEADRGSDLTSSTTIVEPPSNREA